MTMKKADLNKIIDLVRSNKMKKLEIIYMMYTLQRAIREPELTNDDLYKDFKQRSERE